MRYLSVLALLEGPTDEDFFPPVLERSFAEVVCDKVPPTVAIDLVTQVIQPGELGYVSWIIDSVRSRHPQTTMVTLHFDASARPDRERSKYFEPVQSRWRECDRDVALVPLAPKREMEAWALADLAVLESVAGAPIDSDTVFEGEFLDRPERLSDPKKTLESIMKGARRPRGRAAPAEEYLPIIGERVPLNALRRLASFKQFEDDVATALDAMGWTY